MRRGVIFLAVLGLAAIALPVASASVLDNVRDAVADAIDSDAATAGYLLGFFVSLIAMVACYLLIQDGKVVLLFGTFGAIFSALVGWFPIWTLILLALVIGLLLFGMPGADDD